MRSKTKKGKKERKTSKKLDEFHASHDGGGRGISLLLRCTYTPKTRTRTSKHHHQPPAKVGDRGDAPAASPCFLLVFLPPNLASHSCFSSSARRFSSFRYLLSVHRRSAFTQLGSLVLVLGDSRAGACCLSTESTPTLPPSPLEKKLNSQSPAPPLWRLVSCKMYRRKECVERLSRKEKDYRFLLRLSLLLWSEAQAVHSRTWRLRAGGTAQGE